MVVKPYTWWVQMLANWSRQNSLSNSWSTLLSSSTTWRWIWIFGPVTKRWPAIAWKWIRFWPPLVKSPLLVCKELTKILSNSLEIVLKRLVRIKAVFERGNRKYFLKIVSVSVNDSLALFLHACVCNMNRYVINYNIVWIMILLSSFILFAILEAQAKHWDHQIPRGCCNPWRIPSTCGSGQYCSVNPGGHSSCPG